jgi:hypothetical protein
MSGKRYRTHASDMHDEDEVDVEENRELEEDKSEER